MAQPLHSVLSRLKRQIMDILYRIGRGTVGEVMSELTAAPSYSTVRTQLRVLETKGHVRHEEHGLRYIYIPTTPRHSVRQSALKHLMETFFEGSVEKMLSTLLGNEGTKLSNEDLDRLADLIAKARRERR